MCEQFRRSRDDVVLKMLECDESDKVASPYNKGVKAALEWLLGYELELPITSLRDEVSDLIEESTDNEDEDTHK